MPPRSKGKQPRKAGGGRTGGQQLPAHLRDKCAGGLEPVTGLGILFDLVHGIAAAAAAWGLADLPQLLHRAGVSSPEASPAEAPLAAALRVGCGALLLAVIVTRAVSAGRSSESLGLQAIVAVCVAGLLAAYGAPGGGVEAALAASACPILLHAPIVWLPEASNAASAAIGTILQCQFLGKRSRAPAAAAGATGGRGAAAEEPRGGEMAGSPLAGPDAAPELLGPAADLDLGESPSVGEGRALSLERLQAALQRGAASMITGVLRSAVAWRTFDHSVASALRITRVSLSRQAAREAAVVAAGAAGSDAAAARRVVASVDAADDAAVGSGAPDPRERFVEVEAEMEVEGEHCNVFGAMHGGCVLTLVDDVTTLAQLALDCRKPGVTVDISAAISRPIMRGERIRIVARVLSMGRRICFTEAEVIKADGRTAAFGRHTKAL
ncbi:hypothetical protein FNF29_02262 [Cafeteria roenbergensis]|uniref:Thioesterase domain-containing protein n=1 Tax=Cafeteria roenbergensis TaxID=33653 RepID=A0A5A8CNV4_CAFRO|nr:hypothetical protein FNF29_02262 [Cafeteria roenbergensis]|eukprot:KAA0154733.1 hypothetical protein FNF29_02262 [Cafeteria roenbergensis]